ncbi:MAG: phosphoribosyltransferase family protein, partial [Ktedonobacterales bacterium]
HGRIHRLACGAQGAVGVESERLMAPTPATHPLAPTGNLPQRLLDLLFPPRCVHCGRMGEPLCAVCRASIQAPRSPRCVRCDRSLNGAPGPRCGLCVALASQGRQIALGRIIVAADYGDATRSAIRALKFRRQRRLAQPLGLLLVEAIQRVGAPPADLIDLIIPMPLQADRKRERGYNQAALLARTVARALRLPLRDDALTRVRATRPQTLLHRDARRANVAGAFALSGSTAERALADHRILLIDDVTTTGATLEAAAEALLAAQPAAIYAAAVARPLRDLWPAGAEPPDR